MARVAFFGTPEAARPTLDALITSRHEVVAVVTAPDRPQGRGMRPQPSPVKESALAEGLEVLEVPTLKEPSIQQRLADLEAAFFVVVAFGLILPPEVLKGPRLMCLNVHLSELPKLRGAAPVPWALIEGYERTGVTIIEMDEGVDTGPILAQIPEPIRPDDTAGSLEARLARKGAALLLEVLEAAEESSARPREQDDSQATFAPKLGSDVARIEWSEPAEVIARKVRAFNPKPGAWTTWRRGRLKVWAAEVAADTGAEAGLVSADDALIVAAGEGSLRLLEVQPEGKSRMPAADFVRGYRPEPGTVLQ